jgi:hypothetical protein
MNDPKLKNNDDVGHEGSSIQVGGITWFIVGLTVSVVFVAWLMAAVLNTFEGREKQAELESRPSPFAAERPKLPPEPRLQLAPNTEEQIEQNQPPNLKTQHPLEEMKQLRERWDEQLHSYGWVDEQAGVVRIPIEDAKRLLLQRGLPTRPAKKVEPTLVERQQR